MSAGRTVVVLANDIRAYLYRTPEATSRFEDAPVRTRLVAVLPSGATVVDETTDGSLGSIAASGTRLYWLKDGVAQTRLLVL